jgi:DNA-binding NtrC family response regulator
VKSVNLLIVDDEDVVVKLFERLARKEKLSYASAKNGYEAMDFLTKNEAACTVLDINLPSFTGFQVLEFLKASRKPTEVVLITGSASVEHAVKALKMGAFDYLTKPFEDLEKVAATLKHAVEKYRLIQRIHELQEPVKPRDSFQGLIGRSEPMQEIYKVIQSIKSSTASVLIEGESGTGKEMIAQAIHRTSKRAGKPFLVVNCAAIPEGLLESELFGHVKGAFTGAVVDKKGLFEEANGGTIFLDEIGEVSLAFQVKLLRVLQNGEFKRVGEGENRRTDVRVIAATNRRLKERIASADFREDLYYRLHVIGIHLPPLRERKEDIPLLAYHFLEKCNQKMKRNVKEISIDAMQALQNYSWVGNVRELENIIERCVVLITGNIIKAADLPASILTKSFYLGEHEEADWVRFTYREAKMRAISLFNKSYIRNLLKETGGNISLASNKAGLDRSNLKKIIKKYDIDLGEFRRGT